MVIMNKLPKLSVPQFCATAIEIIYLTALLHAIFYPVKI